MKRVVRITQRGKVKDVHPANLNAAPPVDEVDAKVARIQAFVPIAFKAVEEELTAELTRLAGGPILKKIDQSVETGRWPARSGHSPERGATAMGRRACHGTALLLHSTAGECRGLPAQELAGHLAPEALDRDEEPTYGRPRPRCFDSDTS